MRLGWFDATTTSILSVFANLSSIPGLSHPQSSSTQQNIKNLPQQLENQAKGFVYELVHLPWPSIAVSLVFSWFISFIISKITAKLIQSRFVTKDLQLSAGVENRFRRSITWFSTGLILWWSLNGILTVNQAAHMRFLLSSYALATGTWFVVVLWDIILEIFSAREEGASREMRLIALPLVGKIIKVIVVAFGIFLIIAPLGWSVGVVAGISGAAGGIALGFGGKNMAEDLFASIGILMDMPYGVGDYIAIGDGTIQGFVEQINMRSTRIRGMDDGLITVPNSKIAPSSIINYGLRRYQLIQTTYYVTSKVTSDTLAAYCNDIRNYLTSHPLIRKDINVTRTAFYEMDLVGFQILVVTQLMTDYISGFAETEKILLQLVKFAEKYNIEIVGAE